LKGEKKIKIIVVSGAVSGTGKTSLACALLPLLPNFGAIKITIQDLGTKVTDQDEEIMVPGKDTCRLKTSGASKVVWVKSSEEELPEAMGFAWTMIGEVEGTLIEGNSILEHVHPDITFFVVDREITDLKPSRISALKKANVVVINRKEEGLAGEKIEKVIRELNPQASILTMNLKEDNSHLLVPILTRYLGQPGHSQ
jgi:molybdopterin-guanine dinucleotide biosynthesis protein